jgi:antitoxin (DNA-binding transcriptional repressor) of toxin-antitoxin stability system
MRKVGIKTLKNDLSKYIRAAEAGETVLVTDRDRVVAEIGPPRKEPKGTDAERQWADLVAQGVVRLPTRKLTGPPPKTPIMTFDELMADIAADRDDR